MAILVKVRLEFIYSRIFINFSPCQCASVIITVTVAFTTRQRASAFARIASTIRLETCARCVYRIYLEIPQRLSMIQTSAWVSEMVFLWGSPFPHDNTKNIIML